MGHVGFRIARLLRRLGEEVTVVTSASRTEWIDKAQGFGTVVVIGDARDEALLSRAGLATAKALIAATGHDATNVEIALDALAGRPGLPVVLRLFDQTLAHELETTLRLRGTLAMSSLAAPAFASAALGEKLLGAFPLDGATFVVGRLDLPTSSPLHEHAVPALEEHLALRVLEDVRASDVRNLVVVGRKVDWDRATAGVSPRARRAPRVWPLGLVGDVWREARPALRVLAVTLAAVFAASVAVFGFGLNLGIVDALYFLTATVTTTGYGDINLLNAPAALKLYGCLVMLLGALAVATVTSMLTEFLVTSKLQDLVGRRRAPKEGHVVIAGLGNLGYRLVEELRSGEVPFVAIERDEDAPFARSVHGTAPVVYGDARIAEALERAGIAGADAIVAVTGDDAANLGIALTARRLNPAIRTVVRVFDATFAAKARTGLGLHSAMSASRIAAPAFAATALFSGVRAAFVRDGRLVVVLERPAGDLAGRLPSDIEKEGMRLLARSGKLSIPGDDRPIGEGEALVLVVERALTPETSED